MILSVRKVPMLYPAGTQLSVLIPTTMEGTACGSSVYPGGGDIAISPQMEILQVVEYKGVSIIERYFLRKKSTKGTVAGPMYQICMKILGRDPAYTPEVLYDRLQLTKIYRMLSPEASAMGLHAKFLNSIYLKCTLEELKSMGGPMETIIDELEMAPCVTSHFSKMDRLRWSRSADLNGMAHMDYSPLQMAQCIGEYVDICGPYQPPYSYVLGDLEDMFLPRYLSVLPKDRWTELGWKYGGITPSKLKLVYYPDKNIGDVHIAAVNKDFEIPELSSDVFQVIDTVQRIRFTDYAVEYILPQYTASENMEQIARLKQLFPDVCSQLSDQDILKRFTMRYPKFKSRECAFRDRYGLMHENKATDVQYNFYKECELQLDEIGMLLGLLYPNAIAIYLEKNFNNWLFLDIQFEKEKKRYALDMTMTSIISPELTYLS